MLNTGITSTISLRTRGSSSSPHTLNGYSHCSIGAHPFFYPSPRSCCCCCVCSHPLYRVPASPNYCYNLYGFKQSYLIQSASHIRLLRGGLDRCHYARFPVSDCYCDRICSLREKGNGRSSGRNVGFRKFMVFDESTERYDVEAEVVLSLLAEDIDEVDCSPPIKGLRKLLKKPVVEKRENDGMSNKIRVTKKMVDLGVAGMEPRCENRKQDGSLRKKDSRMQVDMVQMEEKSESLSMGGNKKECMVLSANGKQRKKEEDKVLIRKQSQRGKDDQERESYFRKENLNVVSRRDEEGDFLRREEDKENVRRRGESSCSSYYSFSSSGDYYSENETEVKENGCMGDSLTGDHMMGSGIQVVHKKVKEEDAARIENHEQILTRKSKEKEFMTDYRKKSEKKLTDTSTDVGSSEKSLAKKMNFSSAGESNYKKVSGYFGEQKVKSWSESTKLDEDRKQRLVQTGDEDSRQSETRMKHKEVVETEDTLVDDVRSAYCSQNPYNVKGEMSVKAKRLEKVGDHQAAVELGIIKEKHKRDPHKISETSDTQETCQQWLETSVKGEEYSADILTSINVASKQQEDDRVSLLGGSSGASQNMISKSAELVLRRESDKVMNQNEFIIKQTGNPGAISLESINENKSEAGVVSVEPKAGSATNDDSGASLLFASAALYGDNEERSTLAHNYSFHGQPLEFTDQLRSGGISISEIQREEKITETKFASEEHAVEHARELFGSKGPSDDMWQVGELSARKPPTPEIQDDLGKPENAIVKRSGKSLWNILADIVNWRWPPRSESRKSSRTPGGKTSPNQSTSSDTWFSGHEAEDQEEKSLSLVEPSSSAVLETSSIEVLEAKHGDTSSSTTIDSSISSPALRLRKSSTMKGGLEIREENTLDSGVKMEEQESSVSEGVLKQRTFQRKDQILKDRYDEWEEAYMLEAEQRKTDEMFMREALLEAKKAADNWEVPVGAVLVRNGKIIARGCNMVEEMRDSTAHAEIICIREASNVVRTWRLSETTLYITLEPCPMCAGAIFQARIDTVVWGSPNKLLGADGSWIRLFPIGEGGKSELSLTDKPSAPIHPLHPNIVVRRGVLASECADTMQQFFKLRRKKDKRKSETPTTPASCLPITHRPSRFLAKMHDTFSFLLCL